MQKGIDIEFTRRICKNEYIFLMVISQNTEMIMIQIWSFRTDAKQNTAEFWRSKELTIRFL